MSDILRSINEICLIEGQGMNEITKSRMDEEEVLRVLFYAVRCVSHYDLNSYLSSTMHNCK